MKSVLIGVALVSAAAGPANAWRVGQGDVRVICPMTVGGSFDAKTTAISGSITVGATGSPAFDGSLAVDLRTLDTGIGLRNEHLRDTYLEVTKQPGYDTATLSAIDLKGLKPDTPEGKGSFTGSLTLHGVTKTVAGAVEVRPTGEDLRVKASFPVNLLDYSIRRPRYLGIGVKDTVEVEVAFSVTR
jgi:polyisoprenoid-binding protein YceI